jgi:nicotinate phosphoribosyltransferase
LAGYGHRVGEYQRVQQRLFARVLVVGDRQPVVQVRRFYHDDGTALGDMIYNEWDPPSGSDWMVDPEDPTRRIHYGSSTRFRDLLLPMMRHGQRCGETPRLVGSQHLAAIQMATFHAGIRRFDHPHRYPVGLEQQLYDLRLRLMHESRAEVRGDRAAHRS